MLLAFRFEIQQFCGLAIQGDLAVVLWRYARALGHRATEGCHGETLITPHTNGKGRAPVWGSEFTAKAARLQGDSAEIAAGLKTNFVLLVTGACQPPLCPLQNFCRKHEENTKKIRNRRQMLLWRAAQGAPVGAPSTYCIGGAEKFKGSDGEEKKDGGAVAALPHAVAPVGAQSVYHYFEGSNHSPNPLSPLPFLTPSFYVPRSRENRVRRKHRVRSRPPLPYCPASWRLVQDHRATRLGQSMIGALRRKLNLFPHSLLPTAPTYFPTRPWAASTCPARCSSTSSPA